MSLCPAGSSCEGRLGRPRRALPMAAAAPPQKRHLRPCSLSLPPPGALPLLALHGCSLQQDLREAFTRQHRAPRPPQLQRRRHRLGESRLPPPWRRRRGGRLGAPGPGERLSSLRRAEAPPEAPLRDRRRHRLTQAPQGDGEGIRPPGPAPHPVSPPADHREEEPERPGPARPRDLHRQPHRSLGRRPAAPYGRRHLWVRCRHWNRGLFKGAAGLLGLGRGPLSFSSQLRSLNGGGGVFSYCLVDRNSDLSVSSKLVLGEDHVLMAHPLLNFTSFVAGKDNPADTFYYVHVKGIMVGGRMLDIPAQTWELSSEGASGTIVDSGTTLSYFAEPAYQAIREAVLKEVKAYPVVEDFPVLSPCYNVSGVEGPLELPGLVVVFGDGAVWHFLPKNCFIWRTVDSDAEDGGGGGSTAAGCPSVRLYPLYSLMLRICPCSVYKIKEKWTPNVCCKFGRPTMKEFV